MPLGTRHTLTGIWNHEAVTAEDKLFVPEGGYWRLDFNAVDAPPEWVEDVIIVDGVRTGFATLHVLHIRRLDGLR